MDCLIREIPTRGKIFLGGVLNGHVRKDITRYKRVHKGQGFGERNDLGDTIWEFPLALDIVITNTY